MKTESYKGFSIGVVMSAGNRHIGAGRPVCVHVRGRVGEDEKERRIAIRGSKERALSFAIIEACRWVDTLVSDEAAQNDKR